MRTPWIRLVSVIATAAALGCGSWDDTPTEQGANGGSGGATADDAGIDVLQPEASPDALLDVASESSAPDADAEPPSPPEVGWYTCPFQPGMFAECAKLEVPLDWDDPSGPMISYFVKRSPAKNQPARGQVWILQGGPGGSGGSIEFMAPAFRAMADDLDIYIPDHRGTGYSELLDCPEIDALDGPLETVLAELGPAATACVTALQARYGAGLAHFSAAAAARDLGELAGRFRGPNDELYIYGVSYGTRWLHRYLQQFPDQATGVIFDSIVDEVETDWWSFDTNINAGAKRIFDDCSSDTFCQTKMGQDAWTRAQEVLAKLDVPGTCATSANLTKRDYVRTLSKIVQAGYSTRAEVVPLVYRIDRCDATDQVVLANVHATVKTWSQKAPAMSSGLHYNVVSSELESVPAPSEGDILATEETLTIFGGSGRHYLIVRDVWPQYDPSPWLGAYASTTIPVLMLNGTYDIQTPEGPASTFASQFSGENQTWVAIERAPHGALNNSPIAGTEEVCGTSIAAQFLADPTSALDTSCATQTPPIDFAFEGLSYGSGTVDLWENETKAKAGSGKNKVNAIDLLREELARSFGGRL